MGCSKLADRARLPIWFLSTERKHACIRSNWLQEKNCLWLIILQGLAIMKMHVCIKTLMRHSVYSINPIPSQTSQWVYDVKLSLQNHWTKKRKWKLSHRTDTLVKSKYLIISIFSWKEIVKLHETMWPIRDNNTSNGYLFEQESSGETLNTMFVDNRWLISLQYMDRM